MKLQLPAIMLLQPHNRVSAEAKKAAKQLNKSADAWQEQWDELQRDRAAAAVGDLAELLRDAGATAEELRFRECRLLLERSELHRQYLELDKFHRAAAATARDAVLQELQEAEAKAIAELQGAGWPVYHRGMNAARTASPQMAAHAKPVRDLRSLERDLFQQSNNHGFRQRHLADLEACEAWLDSARQQLASLVR